MLLSCMICPFHKRSHISVCCSAVLLTFHFHFNAAGCRMGSSPPHIRFLVTLCVACTFALVQLLLAVFLRRPSSFYNPLAWILALYVVLLLQLASFKWNRLFGGHLSRKYRTLFDEWNVMETYQPRAISMGHLFDPEPPTPFPGDEESTETDRFKAMRDAHYANEFTFIQKMEAERKAMEASGQSSTSPKGSQQSSAQSESMRVELNAEPKGEEDSYREI
ncbi:hypothetical protein ANCCAN_28229 [Ancylostoma caninum]|uniref:Uncharacterized protein n=1 Tax=Ancylostoma caninum TaxID=29170 RepID=A0A368F1Y5_ANCCA|nr:hypothetical protein ANCCAN_28229 [Ancylostoma caninum]